MAIANQLTSNSWILESNAGEKLGIMSLSDETSMYTITSSGTQVSFGTLEELEIAIDERIKIKEREVTIATFKDIEGYPIAHESADDIQQNDEGFYTYVHGRRKKTRYLAGYWAIKGTDAWWAKLSLTEQMREQNTEEGITPIGPFKDKVEALFAAKQANKAMKDADK